VKFQKNRKCVQRWSLFKKEIKGKRMTARDIKLIIVKCDYLIAKEVYSIS